MMTALGIRMRQFKFITVYAITRHYGGPEEGGWWYDWYEPVETVALPKTYRKRRYRGKLELMRAELESKYQAEAWGDIYRSTGGLLIAAHTEVIRREYQTTHRPYYE